MDCSGLIILLGQEEGPSLWRLLGPVVMVALIVMFGWLNERARKKMAEQQEQESKARERGEGLAVAQRRPEVRQTRVEPMHRPVAGSRARDAEQIQRYQPEIPSLGRQAEREQLAEEAEPELIIVAEDVDAEEARRQFQLRQGQQKLRAEAILRTGILQAQRKRQAALAAGEAAQRKRAKQLRGAEPVPVAEVSKGVEVLPAVSAAVSVAGIRRAIVWAEILGQPRALRPYGQL